MLKFANMFHLKNIEKLVILYIAKNKYLEKSYFGKFDVMSNNHKFILACNSKQMTSVTILIKILIGKT